MEHTLWVRARVYGYNHQQWCHSFITVVWFVLSLQDWSPRLDSPSSHAWPGFHLLLCGTKSWHDAMITWHKEQLLVIHSLEIVTLHKSGNFHGVSRSSSDPLINTWERDNLPTKDTPFSQQSSFINLQKEDSLLRRWKWLVPKCNQESGNGTSHKGYPKMGQKLLLFVMSQIKATPPLRSNSILQW